MKPHYFMMLLLLAMVTVGPMTAHAADEGATLTAAEHLAAGDAAQDGFENKTALAHYKSVLETNPTTIDAYWKTCQSIIDVAEDLHDDQGDEAQNSYREAGQIAQIMIEKFPKAAESYYYRALADGKLALAKGGSEKVKLSRAIWENSNKAISIDPNYYRSYIVLGAYHRNVATLGWVLKKLADTLFGGLPGGSLEESEKALLKAIALKPDFLRSYYELGMTYVEIGHKAKAKEAFEKAVAAPKLDHLDDHYRREAQKELHRFR